VEGTTESLTLPPLLALAGLDPLKAGIAVVSVNGVGNVAKWHRLFSILGVPTYCIFDTDSDKTGVKASELLTKRTDIMTALGRNSPEVDAANMSPEPLHVERDHATFNANFESGTAALFGQRWLQLRDEAAPFVGDSKPLTARYAAQRLTATDLPGAAREILSRLADALRIVAGDAPFLLPSSGSPAQPTDDEDPPPVDWDPDEEDRILDEPPF
jgi:putative ATP-dependent endonuclease of OLD family